MQSSIPLWMFLSPTPVHFYKHFSFSCLFICSTKLIHSYPIHCGYLIVSLVLGESCNKMAVAALIGNGVFTWNVLNNNYVFWGLCIKVKQGFFSFVEYFLLEGMKNLFIGFLLYQIKQSSCDQQANLPKMLIFFIVKLHG